MLLVRDSFCTEQEQFCYKEAEARPMIVISYFGGYTFENKGQAFFVHSQIGHNMRVCSCIDHHLMDEHDS